MEDNSQPDPFKEPLVRVWPSTPTVPTLDMDAEFQADPGTVLSTIHGLASVNESMVTSLSSITNLSVVSNTTATNIQIATEVSGYIQGALHCQQHVSQRIPSIQANIPERTKAISVLHRIKRIMDKALILA